MSEVNEERYLYTVYPKKPIRNLTEGLPILRISKSLLLTKEEVLKCFDYGSVYRRFSNDGIIEKFNKYEIDRVHRPHYISREDWAKMNKEDKHDNLTVNGATPETVVVEEPVKEEVKVPEEEVLVATVVEEIKEPETPVVEEVVEEEKPVKETEVIAPVEVQEEVEVFTTKEDSEEVIAETTDNTKNEEVAEETVQNRPSVNLDYNKKKKHH